MKKSLKRLVKISIVVPTKNEEKDLPDLLKSLENQTFQDFEVLLVDAKSTDGTRKIAQNYQKSLNLKIITEDPPIAPSNARNIGIKQACSELILLCDADNVLPKELLGNVYGFFQMQDVAALALQTVPYETNSMLAKLYFQERITAKKIAGLSAFKKDLFLKIGGFDTNLGAGEDADLVRRFTEAGNTIVQTNFSVFHKEPANFKRLISESLWWGRTYPDFLVRNKIKGLKWLSAIFFHTLILPSIIISFFISKTIFYGLILVLLLEFGYIVLKSLHAHLCSIAFLVPIFKLLRHNLLFVGFISRFLGNKTKGE